MADKKTKSPMAEAIAQLIDDKGYSENAVRQTIEKALKAAYKRTYGTDENAIVKFEDDLSDVSIYSRKKVIDGVYDPVIEIELEEARKLAGDEVEEGDEIDILEDPKSFERSAVATGKQIAHQDLNETLRDSLFHEYKNKVGEVIIGTHQREKNGNIFVDLGNGGRVEGYLPVKYQSKLEVYEQKERIKAIIVEVKPQGAGVQLVLSRSDPRLVSATLEKEVPEIADGTVKIEKIVRDAGYRTKIAVSATREEIDPVGSCVGLKGVRIQNVIREIMNEKIDVLKYESDPVEFIKNALSPAQVERVVIMNFEKREALAIVEESQLSLAIGKMGMNVRLANRLCDWNIDVKTVEQAQDIDFSKVDTVQTAKNLFNDEVTSEDDYSEINTISELPGVKQEIAELLKANGIEYIQDFVDGYDNDTIHVEGVTADDLDEISDLIDKNVEFVDESANENEEEPAAVTEETEETAEEEYFCPECGEKISLDMTKCPRCGTEFVFE